MQKVYRDRAWLWKHYVGWGESMSAMAKEARCSRPTIYNWLYESGIPIRSYKEGVWSDRDWLWKHYVIKEESMYVMAQKARCGETTIRYWLHKNEVPIRSRDESCFLTTRNFLALSPKLLRILEGELLGDGCVLMTSGRSARYEHSSKYEEYLIWLSGCLDAWGIEQSGRITDHKDKETGKIYYHYKSRSYPELVSIRKRWYTERDGKMKKTVPKDFRLTPMGARQWHLGDGGLEHYKYGRSKISFATCDFDKKSIDYLIKELQKLSSAGIAGLLVALVALGLGIYCHQKNVI